MKDPLVLQQMMTLFCFSPSLRTFKIDIDQVFVICFACGGFNIAALCWKEQSQPEGLRVSLDSKGKTIPGNLQKVFFFFSLSQANLECLDRGRLTQFEFSYKSLRQKRTCRVFFGEPNWVTDWILTVVVLIIIIDWFPLWPESLASESKKAEESHCGSNF